MVDTIHPDMRQRLHAEQVRLQSELARLMTITGTIEVGSEHAGLGNHMADDASELFEQEKNLALQRNLDHLLEQVEAALRRMDIGTYGHCASCNEPIDRARLDALPYATLCLCCKARQEKK